MTSDRMESGTGRGLFADDVGKVKTNDNQRWNRIRNRSLFADDVQKGLELNSR